MERRMEHSVEELVAQRLRPMELPPLPENPLVSVLIANYNYAHYIGEAIESVLNQTYANFEIVVCDDGSTDDSVQVIHSYIQFDSRIHLITKENGGVASALNAAFAVSKGDIICLLDADDIFETEKLAQIVQAYKKNPDVGFVTHRVLRINDQGNVQGVLPLLHRIPSGWYGPELLRNGGILPDLPPCSGLSLRRNVAIKIFPINESFTRNADGVVHKLAPLATRILGLDSPLARYRLHNANLTNASRLTAKRQKREWEMWQALWKEQKKFLGAVDPELQKHFAPLQESLESLRMQYVISRLEREGGWRSLYNRLITHEDFWKQARMRSIFWISTGYMPTWLFESSVNFWTGQNVLKKLIWRLTAKRHS